MRKAPIAVLPLFLILVPSGASAQGGQALIDLPAGSWHRAEGTHLRDVVPENGFGGWGYDFNFHSPSIIGAWNGGAYDSKRNRMIIWGGGHNDYYGNELYAFDVESMTWERLTDPSEPNEYGGPCIEVLGDGRPNQRHTYDGLAYLTQADRFFANGGSLSCGGGNGSVYTWTFDFDAASWHDQDPSGEIPDYSLAKSSAYDPLTGYLYLHDVHYLYRYDLGANSWTRLSDYFYLGLGHVSAVDTVRHQLLIVGSDHFWMYDIGNENYERQDLVSAGDSEIVSIQAPGIEYDPVSDELVAFAGGKVYSLDLDTLVWTKHDLAGKPPGGPDKGYERCIYGHWRYIPDFNAYVVVTSVDEDVHFYKHTPGSGQPDMLAPAAPTGLTAQ